MLLSKLSLRFVLLFVLPLEILNKNTQLAWLYEVETGKGLFSSWSSNSFFSTVFLSSVFFSFVVLFLEKKKEKRKKEKRIIKVLLKKFNSNFNLFFIVFYPYVCVWGPKKVLEFILCDKLKPRLFVKLKVWSKLYKSWQPNLPSIFIKSH